MIISKFLRPVVPFGILDWMIDELRTKYDSFKDNVQAQKDFNIKFCNKIDDRYDTGMRSNLDVIFYICDLLEVTVKNVEKTMINYDAVGFLLGNIVFSKY